jgi:hypothetical protein
MNVEHLLVARKLVLAANGGTATLALEAGTPYRHYCAWLVVDAFGLTTDTPDVDVQPKFGGEVDGAVVNVTDRVPTKVYQVVVEEIRPPTRGYVKHPNDASPPLPLKSELEITNSHLTIEVQLTVYMMATATIGGA